MQFESADIRFHYHLLFSLTWMFGLMLYPIWIEPTTTQVRTFIYIIVVAWTLINIILFHKFLSKINTHPLLPKSFLIKPDNIPIVLASLLLINIFLHLYPMSFPLMVSDDEAAHASGGIGLISRLFRTKGLELHKNFVYIRISVWITLILTIILLSVNKTRSLLQKLFSPGKPRYHLFLYAIFFLFSVTLFYVTRNMQFHIMLMRYPPIGKILYLFSMSLFGINEFAVRIPQLLFTVFSSILIYRICEYSLESKKTGLLSACIYAFLPMVFYYSGLGELISGEVYFSIIVIYFYLKYVKTGSSGYLLMSFYMISLGFLYKQDIVVMLAILIISILLLKEPKVGISFLFKISYFSLVPIIPYLIIGEIYPNNPFGLDLSNWVRPALIFGYLVVLLKQLSYPLFTLFLISTVFIFLKKVILKPAILVSFICFFNYYIFYTSTTLNTQLYPYLYMSHEKGSFIMGNERYSMIFFPYISISIGFFVSEFTKSIRWKHSFKLIFTLLMIYMVLICTIWQVPPLNAQFVTYKNINSHYFPCDTAMKWVKNNVKDGETILILRVAPSTFYRDKYGISKDKIIDFWYDVQEVSTINKLKAFCNINKISYVMFSYDYADKSEVMRYLKWYRGDEFTEVAKFNLDGNYIFIYKLDSEKLI